jgi:hypothetical protein
MTPTRGGRNARIGDGSDGGTGRRDLEHRGRRPQHRKVHEIGPVYWTVCRVTACEPGKEFGFEVLVGDKPVNNWHYLFTPTDGGTDVTESFRMTDGLLTKIFGMFGGSVTHPKEPPRHAQDPGADQGRRGGSSG